MADMTMAMRVLTNCVCVPRKGSRRGTDKNQDGRIGRLGAKAELYLETRVCEYRTEYGFWLGRAYRPLASSASRSQVPHTLNTS